MADKGLYDEPTQMRVDDVDPKEGAADTQEETELSIQTLTHQNRWRQAILDFVRWPVFDRCMIACILGNTVVMMVKWVPGPSDVLTLSVNAKNANWDYMPVEVFLVLSMSNLVFTAIFFFESLLKTIAFGPRLFVKDAMNVFDAVVVAFSVLENTVDSLKRFSTTNVDFPLPISILRTFRIIRLFKIAKSVKSIRKVLGALSASLNSVIYLALLLTIVTIIYILLGMQLFGGYYPRPELNYTSLNFPALFGDYLITWDEHWPSRYHFDDFGNGLLTVFVVLSGENWNEIMFDNHRATWDYDTSTGIRVPFAIPYFIMLFIVGNLVLFNLFVAILLSNIGEVEDEEIEDEEIDDAQQEGEGLDLPAAPELPANIPPAPIDGEWSAETSGGAAVMAPSKRRFKLSRLRSWLPLSSLRRATSGAISTTSGAIRPPLDCAISTTAEAGKKTKDALCNTAMAAAMAVEDVVPEVVQDVVKEVQDVVKDAAMAVEDVVAGATKPKATKEEDTILEGEYSYRFGTYAYQAVSSTAQGVRASSVEAGPASAPNEAETTYRRSAREAVAEKLDRRKPAFLEPLHVQRKARKAADPEWGFFEKVRLLKEVFVTTYYLLPTTYYLLLTTYYLPLRSACSRRSS